MKPVVDNYQLQLRKAQEYFLTYDQQELIARCGLRHDEANLYTRFLGSEYRISRKTGRMERLHHGVWVDGNSFGEVMTLLDLICDSRENRSISGQWKNMRDFGVLFYSNKSGAVRDPDADYFASEPEAFGAACRALGGTPLPQGDVAYALEVFDGLKLGLQLWLGDEDFPSQLKIMWDANALQYLRFETMHFALGFLLRRLREMMA